MTKTKEKLVDEQIKKWNIKNKMEPVKPVGKRNVITISRQPGTFGRIVAERLSEDLGYDLFDQGLVTMMAENSKTNRNVLETVDEKGLNLLDEWIKYVVDKNHLWPDQYIKHYFRVIGIIANHGKAIIVGRGGNFAVNPKIALRVRITSPLEIRVDMIAKEFSVSKDEALKRIKKTESERSAFVRKYFYKDIEDNNSYDLVINMQHINIDGAVDLIKQAVMM